VSTKTKVYFLSDSLSGKGIGGINCSVHLIKQLSIDFEIVIIPIQKTLGWESIKSQWLRSIACNFSLVGTALPSGSIVLVDAAFARETWIALRYWKLRKKATILGVVHHYTFNIKQQSLLKMLHKRAEESFTRCLDHIFVNSESTREQVSLFASPSTTINRFWVPYFRTRPIGIADLRKKLSSKQADESIRFLFVGGVDSRKGVDHAIRAVLHYHGSRDIEFHIVGQVADWGGFRSTLDELLKLDVHHRISVRGYLSNEALENEFLLADAFLFPSHWEGYGMAVEDALSFGLPVLTYRIGAVPELVQDGESGWVVTDSDTDALAKAVLECVENDAERQKRSLAAFQRAIEISEMRQPMEKPFLSVLNSLSRKT